MWKDSTSRELMLDEGVRGAEWMFKVTAGVMLCINVGSDLVEYTRVAHKICDVRTWKRVRRRRNACSGRINLVV